MGELRGVFQVLVPRTHGKDLWSIAYDVCVMTDSLRGEVEVGRLNPATCTMRDQGTQGACTDTQAKDMFGVHHAPNDSIVAGPELHWRGITTVGQ